MKILWILIGLGGIWLLASAATENALLPGGDTNFTHSPGKHPRPSGPLGRPERPSLSHGI